MKPFNILLFFRFTWLQVGDRIDNARAMGGQLKRRQHRCLGGPALGIHPRRTIRQVSNVGFDDGFGV